MNRATRIAAIAGAVSLAALAPAAAYAQVKPTVTVINPVSSPVNTRITNPVVPVVVSNADPIPVQVQAASAATPLENYAGFPSGVSTVLANGNGFIRPATEQATQITGLVFNVNAGGTSGHCEFHVSIVDPEGRIVENLASMTAFAGRSLSSPAIPFPKLTLPPGYAVKYFYSNRTNELCESNFLLHTITN